MNGPMLETILGPGGLSTWAQPVFCVANGEPVVHAWELSSRGPAGTLFERPKVMFDYVRRKRAEVVVDRDCLTLAFAAVNQFPAGTRFCVNLHPATVIKDPGFPGFLARRAEEAGIPLDRFTLQIVASGGEESGMGQALRRLRKLGLRVGLSDFGVGSANFHAVLQVQPDEIRLDRMFVQGVGCDHGRRAVVAATVQFAAELRTLVVAEGVSQPAELAALRALGVAYVQGDLFCAAQPVHTVLDVIGTGRASELLAADS